MTQEVPQSRIPPDDTVQLPDSAELSGVANMSTLFRVMGHRPLLMEQSAHLLESAMRTGTIEPQLKELVAIRVSQVNACFY
jgi:alkylhydroperoxidase family enzyme